MKRKIALLFVLLIIIIILLPVIFKNRDYKSLRGPDLSDLEYTEIYFNNPIENIRLAGMLFKPKTKGPYPVAILIHGSGPSFRNSPWYLTVAKHLVDNNITVVLPDKRGCEKSDGEWIGADFNNLASDVISAVEYVKNQHEFEYSKIGIIGMSQGGWIAPIASTKSNAINFIAIMSGATVTTDEQLIFEEIYNIEPYTYKFIAKILAPYTAKRINEMEHQKPLAGFDPIPYWKQVTVPVFFAFGENDKNVPVEACINRLKYNELTTPLVRTYSQGGHAIRDSITNFVSKNYLSDLVAFIKNNAK